MDFKNQIPEWVNEGTEPSDSLKTNGFEAGHKPPAGVFNWFWSLVLKAIKEIQEKISNAVPNIVVNAVREETDDGKEVYVVTDSSITELYNGLEITIIPNDKNTTLSPRLKINDLGDNAIRLALSFNCAATNALTTNYLSAGRPITLKYHSELNLGVQGKGAWVFADRQKTSAQDLYGTVPIDGGGTGATTADEARANINAASSGYGFGEQMVEIGTSSTETYENYCEKIDAILAEMPDRTTKLVSAAPPYSEAPSFGSCAALLYKGSGAYASLIPVGHCNIYAYGWRMQKKNSSWQPFEWVDPPMEKDTEYRTTERHNGNPVYVERIVFDTFASNAYVSKPWGTKGTIVDIDTIVSNAAGTMRRKFPLISYDGEVLAMATADGFNVFIYTFGEITTGHYAECTVKYTK